MSTNTTHPFTLDVLEGPQGGYQWTIREHGKLLQRSDRFHASARAAREKGEEALETLFVRARDSRRR